MPESALAPGADRFTDLLWREVAPIRQAIDELDFLRQLGDGTLPLDVFAFYLEQDARYLAGYAKALALLASRSPDPISGSFWSLSSHTTAAVESELHAGILSTVPPSGAIGPSPTGLGYVSYLIATAATEPYPVGAAAVLPCFWVYADVGARLARQAAGVLATDPDHPYARWVTTYGDPAFQASTETARGMVDEAARAATSAEREQMVTAFTIATQYELLFFDTALHRSPWPIVHRT